MGNMVCRSLEAAEQLARDGIECRVLDMHTIKPLDVAAIKEAAEETGCLVTAEDHNVRGGLGGAVAEVLSQCRPSPLECIGVDDRFAESGSAEDLLSAYGLTPHRICSAAHRVLRRRDRQGR
jgi:transketolase